jgi:hypothetical protein
MKRPMAWGREPVQQMKGRWVWGPVQRRKLGERMKQELELWSWVLEPGEMRLELGPSSWLEGRGETIPAPWS